MRIFLSFNSKDTALAEALRAGLAGIEPAAQVFFSPVSLGAGFWLPKLANEIAEAEAFLLLIGPKGIGPWQEIEYYEALDRHVGDRRFVLVPVVAAAAQAPGLPFLRNLNWVETPDGTDAKALRRLVAALRGETVATTTPLWKLVNPYRGLEAMTEANADYFCGRTVETVSVLNTLANHPERCPILIGASGVGKSSVAQAGVLSALKSMRWPGAEGKTPWLAGLANSRTWVHLTMRPGDAPLAALTAAVIRLWGLDARNPDQAALPREWAKRLRSGHNTLADLITVTQEELEKREDEAPARILLYVDQGEELYTRSTAAEARRFSEVLTEGLGDRRLIAFASLRADYFDRLQADEALFKSHEHINVAPLDRAQLSDVVTAPARALSVGFEDDRTADRITTAAAAEPGALPLLSYLLTAMWDGMVKRGDATLRLPAQAIDIGGVLASRAEEFLKANPDQETALRRLLTLRLAAVPSEGKPVRRETDRDECTDAEWKLAARLADHPYRLVVTGEREEGGPIVAEVAHEALLRAWPRLGGWLREERDFLIFKGDAERAERRWRAMGMADYALLTGLDLARAEEWLPKRSDDDLSPQARAFVLRSIEMDRAQKRRQLDEFRKAQVTQSLFLANLAQQQCAAGDSGTALMLAIEALPDTAAVPARPYVPEGELALDGAWRSLRERIVFNGHQGPVISASFSPDGKRIVTASEDKTARLWDAETGTLIGEPLRGHEHYVSCAAFSPDGKRIVTASCDKTARLWDAETGTPLGEPLRGHEHDVWCAAFSPDGKRIVTASCDKTARLWDAETGTLIGEPLRGHEHDVWCAAFSPDGKRIVTASRDKARLWDAETGKPIGDPLTGHENGVWRAAFSPNGKRIVTASWDKTARLWDAETLKPIGEPLTGHEDIVSSAAFSPDGKRIVTASWDKTARLWDAETGKPIGEPLKGHENFVWSAAFSPNGKRIVTASRDKTARLWDAETRKPISEPLTGHADGVNSAAFSPDGKRNVTASRDKTARLWDTQTRKPIGQPLKGHEGSMVSATFSPDGKRIVTASRDKTARLWDAETGTPLGDPLTGHEDDVWCAAFSPDGKRIVTASADKTVRLWDAETRKPIGEPLTGHENSVYSAAFSPDGNRIVTASADKTARLWDAETRKPIGDPLTGHEDDVWCAAFSPDGKRIVTASCDKTARLWDAETGTPLGEPLTGHEDDVWCAAFSPDGKRIVTASADKTARLWDAETGTPLGDPLTGHEDDVWCAAFSPDGKRIVTASCDKTARLWELFASTQEFVAQAKAESPRCLSPAKRKEFFLAPEPPAWCIEMEKWPYQTPAWKAWLADTRADKNPSLPSE